MTWVYRKKDDRRRISNRSIIVVLLFAIIVTLAALTGCQSAGNDITAPITTITSTTTGCSVSGLTVDCSSATSTSVSITFTANESATVYYASGSTSPVSVSTSSSSVTSPGSVSITGSEGETIYVSFFAQDTNVNNESVRTITLLMPDLTAPVTSISIASPADSSSDCSLSGTAYSCDGPIEVTLTTDETATIYWERNVGSAVDPSSSSTQYTAAISIDANDTYLSFFAEDSSSNEETAQTYTFEINGLSASINGGYYNSSQSFTLSLSDNRTVSDYQVHYLELSGTDVSADTSSETVYDATTDVPHNDAVRYLDTYNSDDTEETITATATDEDTVIYLYKYNLIQSVTFDATGDVTGGYPDKENSLALYIDQDNPRLVVVPPSSGSLDSIITVAAYLQDDGHDKVASYVSGNSELSDASSLEDPSATYCESTSELSDESWYFWEDCTDSANINGLSNGSSITVATDTLLGITGQDAAGNDILCQPFYDQYTCEQTPMDDTSQSPHFAELYTPGMQQTQIFHENEEILSGRTNSMIQNFGHSVAVGDFDGDQSSDIAIGAPAFGYSYSSTNDLAKGAVYIWYNGLRERAIRSFIANDATTDLSSKYIDVSTDGYDTMRIYLDPNDTPVVTDYYQALSSDISDDTAATAAEIATVLNKAFLSSRGTSYQNYLYADASYDGYLAIGHVNRTIQGYYNFSSNFSGSSGFNYTGTVRAYDYAIFGENAGDEFGHSLAIAEVDSNAASGYSSDNLIVGAPGYDSDNGAVYVLQIPDNDASADYSHVSLSTDTTDMYRIAATTGTGRFGHAILIYDNDNSGTEDINVSAPYYSGTYSNGGAVYIFSGGDYSFDATDDTSAADASIEWDGLDSTSDAANSLFGYSMTAGYAKVMPTGSSTRYLIVGAPGLENTTDHTGSVTPYLINSISSLTEYGSFVEDGEQIQNHFGYSLALTDSDFDSSSEGNCPCLVVGAPGSDSNNGTVWLLGDAGYEASISGSGGEMLGVNILATEVRSTDNYRSIFIASQEDSHTGSVILLTAQDLSSTSILSFTTLSDTIEGSNAGDNLGRVMSFIEVGSDRGLLTGLPGEYFSTSTYYKYGGEYNRIGGVRVYSTSRLGL